MTVLHHGSVWAGQVLIRSMLHQAQACVQVVRRLFLLVGTAALVACKAGSGGVDVALGPNVGCSPLGLLGPAAILHGLVAGPGTEDPRMTTAALPVVSMSWLPNAQIFSLMPAIAKTIS